MSKLTDNHLMIKINLNSNIYVMVINKSCKLEEYMVKLK